MGDLATQQDLESKILAAVDPENYYPGRWDDAGKIELAGLLKEYRLSKNAGPDEE